MDKNAKVGHQCAWRWAKNNDQWSKEAKIHLLLSFNVSHIALTKDYLLIHSYVI
jgi:hypothetical protein